MNGKGQKKTPPGGGRLSFRLHFLHRHYPDQVQRSDPRHIQGPSQLGWLKLPIAFILNYFNLTLRRTVKN